MLLRKTCLVNLDDTRNLMKAKQKISTSLNQQNAREDKLLGKRSIRETQIVVVKENRRAFIDPLNRETGVKCTHQPFVASRFIKTQGNHMNELRAEQSGQKSACLLENISDDESKYVSFEETRTIKGISVYAVAAITQTNLDGRFSCGHARVRLEVETRGGPLVAGSRKS